MEACLFRTCFFLLLFGVLAVAANPVSKNPFSFVPSVLIQKSSEENSTHTLKACLDQGTNSTLVKSGFLASQEELSQLCQPSDASWACKTIHGLVNYICNIQGVQYGKVESEINNTLPAVCLAFRNETFLSKLEDASQQKNTTLNINLNNNVTFYTKSANFPDCEEICNSSLRLCQIILQTLKTIIIGVKQTMVDKLPIEPSKSKSEETMPPTTVKILFSDPASPSTPTDTKTTKNLSNSVENSKDKQVIQTTGEDTENKGWIPMSPDTGDEDISEGMGKPDPSDDDPDLDDKDFEVNDNKLNNDAFIGTPTKPSQSYDSESEIDEDPVNTHFIFYFLAFVAISVCGYLLYQRRNRIVALVLEGRTGQARRRGRSSRSRGSSGSYHKLVNNLEEAITSNSVKNSNVVY